MRLDYLSAEADVTNFNATAYDVKQSKTLKISGFENSATEKEKFTRDDQNKLRPNFVAVARWLVRFTADYHSVMRDSVLL